MKRSRWIFRAIACVGTSQGLTRCVSTARAQQARKKDMLPRIAGKTRKLRGRMKFQLPLKELVMPPRLVATSDKEDGACEPSHI